MGDGGRIVSGGATTLSLGRLAPYQRPSASGAGGSQRAALARGGNPAPTPDPAPRTHLPDGRPKRTALRPRQPREGSGRRPTTSELARDVDQIQRRTGAITHALQEAEERRSESVGNLSEQLGRVEARQKEQEQFAAQERKRIEDENLKKSIDDRSPDWDDYMNKGLETLFLLQGSIDIGLGPLLEVLPWGGNLLHALIALFRIGQIAFHLIFTDNYVESGHLERDLWYLGGNVLGSFIPIAGTLFNLGLDAFPEIYSNANHTDVDEMSDFDMYGFSFKDTRSIMGHARYTLFEKPDGDTHASLEEGTPAAGIEETADQVAWMRQNATYDDSAARRIAIPVNDVIHGAEAESDTDFDFTPTAPLIATGQ